MRSTRIDRRRACGRIEPRCSEEPFGTVARWARDLKVGSLLDHGEGWWAREANALRREVRAAAFAFLRYARHRLLELRERQTGLEVWD